MREIKFRAWDGINNQMIYPKIIKESFSYLSSGDLLNRYENIMQYTGLKDKNGTEIYEGDILKLLDSNYEYKVVFEDGAFYCYHTVSLDKSKWGLLGKLLDLSVKDFEIIVIGNIHENPELL